MCGRVMGQHDAALGGIDTTPCTNAAMLPARSSASIASSREAPRAVLPESVRPVEAQGRLAGDEAGLHGVRRQPRRQRADRPIVVADALDRGVGRHDDERSREVTPRTVLSAFGAERCRWRCTGPEVPLTRPENSEPLRVRAGEAACHPCLGRSATPVAERGPADLDATARTASGTRAHGTRACDDPVPLDCGPRAPREPLRRRSRHRVRQDRADAAATSTPYIKAGVLPSCSS